MPDSGGGKDATPPAAGTPGRAKSHTTVVLGPTFPQLPSAGTATRESVEAASVGVTRGKVCQRRRQKPGQAPSLPSVTETHN